MTGSWRGVSACVGAFLALARPAFGQGDQAPAPADVAPPAAPVDAGGPVPANIEELSLEQLLNPSIKVATKSELHVSQTPAVVTVISSEEIAARGYTSLADILRAVPGFYDDYDLVTHNIGVRGISGGINASGDLIKLMIDGHSVDNPITTGNFFGEELIPIQLIERVEIIRGPASALYGADAFLGVINVVTRDGKSLPGVRAIADGVLVRGNTGGGGGLIAAGSGGGIDAIFGGHYLYTDRSGLQLPSSSPLLPNAAISAQGPSQADYAQPATFFGKVALDDILGGKLTLEGSVQRLDSHGEFQYFGPLSHGTRITVLNQNYWLNYEVAPSDIVSLVASVYYFAASPTPDARYDTNQPGFLMLPSASASGPGGSLEVHLKPHRTLSLTVGADYLWQDNQVETYNQLITQATLTEAVGTVVPGNDEGARHIFRNVGAFLQGLWSPTDSISAVVGGRLDDHNIYGTNLSGRAGVVYAKDALNVKLLYGSSFKAPSAEQLYAEPVVYGGILGNPHLLAQTAHSVELAAGYRLPKDVGEIQLNGFVTDVLGRVEFLPAGNYIIAQNIQNEWVVGGELSSRFVLTKSLHLTVAGGVARTASISGGSALIGEPQVLNPLFPVFQIHGIVDYALPWWGLHAMGEVSYIGPRESSFSNAIIAGASYSLSPYVYTGASITTSGLKIFGERETRVALRVTNLLNNNWTEPGFAGVDVPAQGITAFLTVVQAL